MKARGVRLVVALIALVLTLSSCSASAAARYAVGDFSPLANMTSTVAHRITTAHVRKKKHRKPKKVAPRRVVTKPVATPRATQTPPAPASSAPASSAPASSAPASSAPASSAPASSAPASSTPSSSATPPRSPASVTSWSIGNGLLGFPTEAEQWVQANPNDPRSSLINSRIASQPVSLWLTGDESFGNLAQYVAAARSANKTMVLALYNIPLRWDGLTTASSVTPEQYQTWIARIASMIGSTRAVIVLEPDALWFVDRMPTEAMKTTRLTVLRNAVATLHAASPQARVYLDAGTSSGSVTPARMATLLTMAGLGTSGGADGYAVNTSSFSPAPSIASYAQAIRSALIGQGVSDPRYVVDTSRNGNPNWDNTWCNPTTQRLGTAPAVVRDANGLDADLWIKGPGTSDGDCGSAGYGQGSYGGQFLPLLAYKMISG